MIPQLERVIAEMNSALQQLNVDESNILVLASKAILIVQEYLDEFTEIDFKKFKSKDEEVKFFKYLKPRIYSNLFYYTEVYNIEGYMPPGSNKKKEEHINFQFEKIDRHYEENKALYFYYNTSSSQLDEQYFTRIDAQLDLFPSRKECECVTQLKSLHDETFARIIAYEKLSAYLKSSLNKLQNKEEAKPEIEKVNQVTPFFWTDTESSFMEVAIGIHSSITGGIIDFNEFVERLGKALGTKSVSDVAKKKHKLKERENPTAFVDKMKATIENELFKTDKFFQKR